MEKVFESFKEFYYRVINEGGHTFPNVTKIRKEDIQPTLTMFFKNLYKKLGITEKDTRALGSVGKKAISGDIDILINGEVVAKHLNIKGNLNELNQQVPLEIYNIMNKEFGKKYLTNYTAGLKVGNIAFPIYTVDGKTDEFVQIDLMTAFGKNALDFGAFYYHSPDITKGESIYTGAHRTNLLRTIFRFVDLNPEEKDEQYFKDEYHGNYKGLVKSFNKLSILQYGLLKQHKSFKGKTKPLKNPKTIKKFNKLVSEDPDEVVKILLGPNATVKDANSFESLFTYIESGKNKNLYKRRKEIYQDYVKDYGKRYPIPDEIKKYL